MEKYLQEDKIAQFVYEKVKPDLKCFVDYKLKGYTEDHRNEFLDYSIDRMIDFMNRGNLIYNFPSAIGKHHLLFLSETHKTVQLNEEIKYNNGNTDDY